jgi:hypothetical protein
MGATQHSERCRPGPEQPVQTAYAGHVCGRSQPPRQRALADTRRCAAQVYAPERELAHLSEGAGVEQQAAQPCRGNARDLSNEGSGSVPSGSRHGYGSGMSEEKRDFQLTGDDPMLEQIEAATTASAEAATPDPGTAASQRAGDEGRPPALAPGEPDSAQFEPDASQ